MTKQDLADKSGVSISFISDLTTGKGNPSLKTMQSLAEALETPLPLLLESTDLDSDALKVLFDEEGGMHLSSSSLPLGFQRICAILPDFQAYQVTMWAEAARKRLRR